MKKLICALLMATTLMSLCACGADDVYDQVQNIVQEDDQHVLAVKNGTPNAYPDQKYGETFDAFFASPTWKYFVGTQEGADEDGDGKADYTKENVDIVEFTGYCTYQDVEVKALIQFTLNEDGTSFEATYLSLNDVPQDRFMLSSLLEAVFNDEDITDVGKNETDDMAISENENTGTDVDNTEDQDALLDEFIELVCSYSDPPYEVEDLDAYFKGEFELWLSGEGYTNITTDENGHLILPDHSTEYVGEWWDTYSQRCAMEISSEDGISYSIDINWGNSAWDNTHWSFWGTYDEILGGIHYYGSEIEEYYAEDGTVEETYVYTDGEGIIYLADDGTLYWNDYKEQAGAECIFEKAE